MKTFSDSACRANERRHNIMNDNLISNRPCTFRIHHQLLNDADILASTQPKLIPFKTFSIQNNEMVCLTCKIFDVVL